MENNKNKKSVNFQGDMLNFCDFIQVFVFTTNHHLNWKRSFSTVFTRIAGDFGLVAQNPLTENGLLFMILSLSADPVWDLIKTRMIKLFERKHWLRIYRSVIN